MGKFLKQFEILNLKANKDLYAARYLLDGVAKNNNELDLEIIFFHLQQAAEKYLKTLLDYNKIKFPKVHDIKALIELLKENNITIPDDSEELIPLTDYAVEGRYAIIHDDMEDAGKYLELLDELKLFVEKKTRDSGNH